jgi:hypothetical protein
MVLYLLLLLVLIISTDSIGRGGSSTNIDKSANKMQFKASSLLGGHKLYMTITSTPSRLDLLASTIDNVMKGVVVPDVIIVYFDKHINEFSQTTPPYLLELLATEVSPGLKLLQFYFDESYGDFNLFIPIVKKAVEKSENCLILTWRDDLYAPERDILNLITYYLGDSSDDFFDSFSPPNCKVKDPRLTSVSRNSRRIGLCNTAPALGLFSAINDETWPTINHLKTELLAFPLVRDGVLFHPSLLYKDAIFDNYFLKKLISDGISIDVGFRLLSWAGFSTCEKSRDFLNTYSSSIDTETLISTEHQMDSLISHLNVLLKHYSTLNADCMDLLSSISFYHSENGIDMEFVRLHQSLSYKCLHESKIYFDDITRSEYGRSHTSHLDDLIYSEFLDNFYSASRLLYQLHNVDILKLFASASGLDRARCAKLTKAADYLDREGLNEKNSDYLTALLSTPDGANLLSDSSKSNFFREQNSVQDLHNYVEDSFESHYSANKYLRACSIHTCSSKYIDLQLHKISQQYNFRQG